MEKLNELIFHIEAILGFAKDIHYNNIGYANHLLADRVVEGVDIQDDIKEQMILAERELPLSSKEYLNGAISLIPDIKENDRENWISLWGLIDDTRKLVEQIKANRGGNALLDNLAQALNTSSALLYIQTRKTPGLNEEVEHDHKAATETPVDREERTTQITADADVAKTVAGYSNQEAALLGESTLDRLSKKLGI